MTVRHSPNSLDSLPIATASLEQFVSHPISERDTFKSTPLQTRLYESAVTDLFWDTLIDLLPDGVVVMTRSLKLIHMNHKAKKLCQTLIESLGVSVGLPPVLAETCQRLIRQTVSEPRPVVVEYQASPELTVRIRASWFVFKPNSNLAPSPTNRQLILLLLKNCTEALDEELEIEQQKYDLTDREAEIWSLLRQENTYQEIAQKLQISLNTVKTHVKNVYAKKRSVQGHDKVLIL